MKQKQRDNCVLSPLPSLSQTSPQLARRGVQLREWRWRRVPWARVCWHRPATRGRLRLAARRLPACSTPLSRRRPRRRRCAPRTSARGCSCSAPWAFASFLWCGAGRGRSRAGRCWGWLPLWPPVCATAPRSRRATFRLLLVLPYAGRRGRRRVPRQLAGDHDRVRAGARDEGHVLQLLAALARCSGIAFSSRRTPARIPTRSAAHLLSDVASFAISLFAVWLAERKPTSTATFGFHRIEIFGAILSVFLIWVLTGACTRAHWRPLRVIIFITPRRAAVARPRRAASTAPLPALACVFAVWQACSATRPCCASSRPRRSKAGQCLSSPCWASLSTLP